jgi:hypothetical protein
MIKTTLVKWAVAAMLAVPAVPMFGSTLHHRVASRTHTRHVLTAKKHRLSTRSHRRSSLSTHRKLSHRLASRHKLSHKSSVRGASMNSGTTFHVRPTKMPPTIDGINT